MFTGIVQELGHIASIEGSPDGVRLRVDAPGTASRTEVGDSIAINGVCLTVADIDGAVLAFDAVPETLSRTTLGSLDVGALANVEPSLRAGEPLGGHIVAGHVDGVGRVSSVIPEGDGVRIEIEAPDGLARYCVEKGSIGVEGVSLTLATVGECGFAIALIPHTLSVTTLGSLSSGDEVNLEVDVLAKYVERLLAARLDG